MRSVSITTCGYNEEENVEELYSRVRAVMAKFPGLTYEHIFIDNSSRDSTVAILKRIASQDHNVKVIVNSRNFGHIRSPIHAFLEAQGDAVIGLAADMQDPPEMIEEMISQWEEGYKMVLCIKKSSQENPLMFRIRSLYYRLVQRLSSLRTFENFTGFGLYDRQVVQAVRSFLDAYPYFRGIIAEIGFPHYDSVLISPAGSEASPAITSTSCMTWPCWASPICPRCRCEWLRFSVFFCGGLFVLAGFAISFTN